jgi:hypothetical protein
MKEMDEMYAESAAEPYMADHRPDAQPQIEGVPINPHLRPRFEMTDNGQRDRLEVEDWYGLPFIQFCPLFIPDASYGDHCERMGDRAESREDYEARMAQLIRGWYEQWPEGIRYDVRCLDGGAWDRSTWRGSFETLADAVGFAKALASNVQNIRRAVAETGGRL